MRSCKNTALEFLCRIVGGAIDAVIEAFCQNILPVTIHHNKTTTALRPITGISLIVISS